MRYFYITLVLLLTTTSALAAAAKPPDRPVEAGGQVIGTINAQNLFRHTGKYPPLSVTWKADARLQQVLGVYPHDVLPGRVVAATATGLFLSEDAGAAWTPLAKTGPDDLGAVRHVAFAPNSVDTFYVATDRKGVFATEDAGKTFRPIGSKATGLASDEAAGVCVYPGDRRLQSLLVWHGEAAPGLSYSPDAGHTWRVLSTDFFVHQVLVASPGDQELFFIASPKGAKDVRNAYYALAPDEHWVETMRDVVPTDAAVSLLWAGGVNSEKVFRGANPYLSTADQGLFRLTLGDGDRVGPAQPNSLASVGLAWGPTADSQVLFAYDARRLGMVTSMDDFETIAPQPGLPAGPFIREGARVRANSNGAAFYAVANDALYLGRRALGGPGLVQACVTPPVFAFEHEKYDAAMRAVRTTINAFPQERHAAEAARQLLKFSRDAEPASTATEFTVTAQVSPADYRPVSVTADLSRFGGSPVTPMFDDGKHGDGAAGDGRYGAVFRMEPDRVNRQRWDDWRRLWPGLLGVTVTAVGPDGALSGLVAPIYVFDRPGNYSYHAWDTAFPIKQGPWERWLGSVYYPHDVDGYYGLGFWIRTDGAALGELSLQAQDTPEFSPLTLTPKVPLVKEGFVAGGPLGPEWRRAVVPFRRLLRDSPTFQRRRLGSLVLSGESPEAATVKLSPIRLYLTAEDAKAEEGAVPK